MENEPKPWEDMTVLHGYMTALLKQRKAVLVHRYLNPPPGRGRWVGGAHHPSKWRKEEIAMEIARQEARADYDAGKFDA